MRLSLLFTLLLISIFSVFIADAGTVKGIVTDKQTGEPLVGAVVLLEGTSLGTVTGLDGSYTIRNVPVGNYVLKTKYTSYDDVQIKVSIITETESVALNLRQSQKNASLTEVTIKGKLANGSDEEARHREKNADELMNVMSAHTIELLPDITVADVLQRVSGVQVQRDNSGNARYAVIRGMDKRYNYTTVNGVKIASPDDKGRYIPMDIFPAEIVERVEVIKTLTPSMEGDAVGGVMNVVMKNAPDQLTVAASAATGYNQTLFDRKYTTFASAAINEHDPAAIHGSTYAAQTSDFTRGNSAFRQIQAKPNDLYSFSFGNRFLKNKKLGVMVAGSYQNTYKGSNEVLFVPSAQPNPGNILSITDLLVRKYDKQETRTGIHTKFDYRFNDKNEISLYALFLQMDERESRFTIDTSVNIQRTGAGSGPVAITQRSAFRKQNVLNATLSGKHLITDRLKVEWIGAMSQSTRDVPDLAELHTETGAQLNGTTGKIVDQDTLVHSWSHSWEKTTDKDMQGFLNITYSPTIFGKDIEFAGGGMYRHKDRNNYYNTYTLQPTSSTEVYDNIYDAAFKLKSGTETFNPYSDLTYSVVENISAYYLQAKLLFWNKLQVLGGARIENTHQEYTIAQNPTTFVGQNGAFDYTDVLPSVHLKYALSNKENIRLSYFSSISRPGFFEIVPYTFSGEEFDEKGNYNLKHSTAQNLDARYEWFPKGIDQVLIGAFYKSIDNPIEYGLASSTPSNQYIMPINQSNPAHNYGAEIVVTKFFHYIGISLNYTYTKSAITDSVKNYVKDPATGHTSFVNTTEQRPLQGQAPHIGNASLIYKNPTIGLDAHLTLAYTGRMISYVSPWLGLDYWQKGLALLDFSFEKRITKHLAVYAKVNNILNTPTIIEATTSKAPFTSGTYSLPYQTLSNSVLLQRDYYGRNYLVGIKFKLN